MSPSFERIILSRPDRIGDVVVSTVCIASLKERFPGAQIFMLVDEAFQPLLDGHPLLAGVVGLPLSSKKLSLERLNSLFALPGESLLVELNEHPWVREVASRYPALMCRRYKKSRFDFSSTVSDQRGHGFKHEALASWDLLEGLGVSVPSSLHVSLPSYDDAWPGLALAYPELSESPFAVFHLTAHGGKRSWPVRYFVQVAHALAASRGWRPVLVGAEDSLCDTFVSSYQGEASVINLSGKTSLRELGALLSHGQLVLSRDSGPAHLGASVGCPTVALMTSHPKHCARRWSPLGGAVAVVEQPLLRKKLFESRDAWWERVFASISVDRVLTAIERVISLRT